MGNILLETHSRIITCLSNCVIFINLISAVVLPYKHAKSVACGMFFECQLQFKLFNILVHTIQIQTPQGFEADGSVELTHIN